ARGRAMRNRLLARLLMPRELRELLAEAKTGGSKPLAMTMMANALIKIAGEMKPLTERQLAKMSPQDRGRYENMLRMARATEAVSLDRKPTLQRNGRDVVTDALDEETLRSAP